MKRGILTLLVSGLGIATITSGISAQTPVESLLERLPDNTLGFIATSGGDYLAEPFQQSIVGQIWHDPRVQRFIQQIKEPYDAAVEKGDDLPNDFAEIWPMFKLLLRHPCLIGAAGKPKDNDKDSMIYGFIIVDAGEDKSSIDKFIREALPKYYDGEMIEVKIGSHTMLTGTGEEEGPDEEYWGWVGNYLVSGINDPDGLCLQNLHPSRQRLHPNRITVLQEITSYNDALVLYLNIAKFFPLAESEFFEDEVEKNKFNTIMSAFGFDALQSISARLGFKGQNLVLDALLKTSVSQRGWLNCIKPVNLSMLDFVENQASSVSLLNMDIRGAYNIIYHLLRNIDPKDSQKFDRATQVLNAKLGFKIREDLLENLTGSIVYYGIPAATIMEAPSGGLVLLLQLRDSKKIESCFTRIDKLLHQYSQGEGIERGMFQVHTLEQAGKTLHIWTFAPLAMFAINPTWTIAKDHLIIASHPSLALRAVKQIENPNRHAQSIRTTPGFQQVAKDLPPSLLSFTYTNAPVEFKQLLVLLQRFWPLVTMGFKENGITLPPMLPTINHIIEKMGPSYEVSWSDAAGYHSHSEGPLLAGGTSFVTGSAMAISILMPALGRARELAQRVQCASQLRGLGNAIAMYQNDFEGKNPKSLQELIKTEDVPPKALVCPSSSDEPGQCSYIYRGADLNASVDSEMIVAYDKHDNHDGEARNILFAGGQVERHEEDAFQELIRKDNELRRRMGLAEIPADVEPAPSQRKRPVTFE